MKIQLNRRAGVSLLAFLATLVIGTAIVVGIVVLIKKVQRKTEAIRVMKEAQLTNELDSVEAQLPDTWLGSAEEFEPEELVTYLESVRTWHLDWSSNLIDWVDTANEVNATPQAAEELLYDLVRAESAYGFPAGFWRARVD